MPLFDLVTSCRPCLVARGALRSLPVVLVIGVAAPQLSCAAFETNLQDTEVSYQDTAQKNFDEAEAAFQAGRYNEAIKFFEHVKNKYPYSQFAVLAELRTADAHYAREKWLEAADAYRLFTRYHPRHERVEYATFRVARSFYEAMGEDFFLFPPAREMDQTATQDAIAAFDDYLARFPSGENATTARELRVSARTRLAEHDLYAAEFYAERQKWRGAAWRYERVAKEFADTPLAAEALLQAAQIHEGELAEPEQAKTLYTLLVEQHPSTDAARLAEQRLAALSGS